MNDDAEGSAEAQRKTPDESEMGAASTMVAPNHDARRLVTAFVWVIRYGVHLAVAGSLLLTGPVFVFDMRVPCSLQIVGLTVGLSAVIAGRWIGGQAADLMGGPQVMRFVDVDLFDRDGADAYTCPTPQWSEWTVVDGQLWWTTPNLALDRGVNLNMREVARTWVGLLPGPVLARTLGYLRYSRKQLEPKARRGGSLEIDFFIIVRAAAVKIVKRVVRTFERGVLPDDGDALYAEIDDVLKDFDLDGSDPIFDEDPTEWAPDDSDSAPDSLTDLGQRRKQHMASGESE